MYFSILDFDEGAAFIPDMTVGFLRGQTSGVEWTPTDYGMTLVCTDGTTVCYEARSGPVSGVYYQHAMMYHIPGGSTRFQILFAANYGRHPLAQPLPLTPGEDFDYVEPA